MSHDRISVASLLPIIFYCLMTSCGSDPEPAPLATEVDIPKNDDAGQECALGDSCTCTIHQDCPIGALCEFSSNKCFSANGCGVVWNEFVPKDIGCLYEHGEDLSMNFGFQTYAECRSDDECRERPERINCIHRVCHRGQPCHKDEECPSGEICFRKTLCVKEEQL